jgi:hypothetical protein
MIAQQAAIASNEAFTTGDDIFTISLAYLAAL